MLPIVKFKNIKKKFGKKLVLDNINLEINKGEIFGIIGLSGSGKTTLLNVLINFYEQEQGEVMFYSFKDKKHKSTIGNVTELRKIFGFSAQLPSFYPKLTVEENLIHLGDLYRMPKKITKRNMNNLLKLTNLNVCKKELAKNLSIGMQKRLSIVCSLIHQPKVLVLDEPTANLDPISREGIWQIIKKLHKKGTTIIIASHLLSELESVCTKFSILHNNKIIDKGTLSQLKKKYNKKNLKSIFKLIEKKK